MPSSGQSFRQDPQGYSECPSFESLERLAELHRAGDIPKQQDPTAAHVRSCRACAALLKQMRSADNFLDRFRGPLSRSGDIDGRDPSAAQPAGSGTRPVVVDGYDIERLIAFGGQGAVYQATQKSTDRIVAIKVPLANTTQRPSTRYRFEREVELAARLDHPGIVRIIEACTLDDGRLGYVMEFVEGETFDRWAAGLRPDGRVGLRRIVTALADVVDAISYAHLRAVLHRDIKPGNVLVTPQGRARVLDFGLAKSLDGSGSSFATITGGFMGTLAYAAPEQISSGADTVDLRTDVYALGLLAFQAITGSLPFSTDAPTAQILREIREDDPARPSSLAPNADRDLDAIVLKALAKAKSRRYTTAGDLRDDLRAWLDGRAVEARFDSRWYVIRKAVCRHRWAVSLLLAALVVAGILAALALGVREQASKARVANALNDAQIVASHPVRMADARASASDNFQYGETLAWNGLLDPAPALISRGVEGVSESGLPPASPAYWALWEIYHRTPVVATIPDFDITAAVFAETPGHVITADEEGLTWWDWTMGQRVQRVKTPFRPLALHAGWGQIVALTSDSNLFVSDSNGRDWERVPSASPVSFAHGNGRVTIFTTNPAEMTIWDTTRRPSRMVNAYPMLTTGPKRGTVASFDAAGRYCGFVDESGELIIIDTRDGQVAFERPSGTAPTLAYIGPRGGEGDFDAWGIDGAVRVVIGEHGELPSTRVTPRALMHETLPHAATQFMSRPGIDRRLYRTAYMTMGVLDGDHPRPDDGQIRNVAGVVPDLSHDGKQILMRSRDSARIMVYDIDADTVFRLPFPSEPGPRGFATIFDLAFSADSTVLFAASIDGSVRRFETAVGGEATTVAEALQGGAIRLAPTENGVLVGGHYFQQQPTHLTLLKPDGTRRLLATAARRFTSIISDSNGKFLAISDSGELFRIDPNAESVVNHVDLGQRTPSDMYRSLALMPEGGPLIAGFMFNGILVLNQDTLDGHRIDMPGISIRRLLPHSTDPALFVTTGDDGLIRVWRLSSDYASVTLVQEFGSHAGSVFSMAIHPNGSMLATAGGTAEARDVRLWDLHSGRELVSFDLFAMGAFDIEFSPDGRWLAAGGEVDLDRPEEGGQLFLIDLHRPDRAIAGGLEYHIARFTREHGRAPSQAEALRRLFPLPATNTR